MFSNIVQVTYDRLRYRKSVMFSNISYIKYWLRFRISVDFSTIIYVTDHRSRDRISITFPIIDCVPGYRLHF